uniref:Vitellogenin 3, phosvitinless n=1 Tax=Neogobius melanostomus TaxID=47308 RepID=A0A8C6TKD5_9GOBI
MRSLLLCCLVALADLSLDSRKIYEYQYEGHVKFGLEKRNHAESGARMKAAVKIVGSSADTFLLQFSSVVFEEFNGVPGKSDFVAANQIAEKIAAQLAKPITFTYSGGNVGEIRAPSEVTDTVVNIVRGVLGFFQVTVKTTQEIYDLEEVGIHGKCLSSYAQKTNTKVGVMDLTQVVDVTNCIEMAAYYTGLATAVENKVSQQKGESLFSTVKYTYNIKGSEQGGVITKAQAMELQYFTPFNVKKGSFRMEARKELVLTSVKDKTQDIHVNGQMESRGKLMFKIVKNANIPVVMQNLDNPVPEATKLIQRLAQANAERIDSTTTEEVMKLYQLLRKIPVDKLKQMWTDMKTNPDQRYWFLHTVVEVNDRRILEFLDQYLSEPQLNVLEALTVIVQAFHHLETSPELLEAAERILNKNYNNDLIRKTVVLSYGSLVFKHCAHITPCPEAAIRPLLNMAEKIRSGNDETEKILVLKALGNAGHPRSLKTITKFLPGVDPNPDQVDKRPRVVSAAVQAMRLIAIRDPHGVQLITLKLFLNRELEAEIRMLAFMTMFDTKPSMALVSTVTAHLLEERDMQVVNFATTYLWSLARATTPDNHYLSTAASVAMKILARKFGHLSYIRSSATRMDWFNKDFLVGTAAEAFIMKRASEIIPAEMMVKLNFHFIGRILQLLEFGIRPGGIRHLFGANIPGFNGEMSKTDFLAVYDVLKKWETLPDDKPLFSFFTRASGQELLFSDVNKAFLQRLIRAFSQSAGKDSMVWTCIERLMQGISWRGVLPFLTAEGRYIQATTLGFPVEISKYYHVVNGMSVNGKRSNVKLTENLGQLLTSQITLTTEGHIGYNKNLWLFYGINTDLFQSAVEVKTTSPLSIPVHVVAKINVPARKFELEIPRSNKEIELFSFRSNAWVISRNIIHPDTPKKTPIGTNEQSQSVGQKYAQVRVMQNKWHAIKKMCSKSSIYGLAFCAEMDLQRVYYQEEYPLYYFLGSTHFALKVAPVQESSVEKIRLEINANPSSSSSVSVRQLIDTLRKMGIGGSPMPLVQLKVVAESGSSQKGYDTSLYYTPEGEHTSAQLILSHIGESPNWKMCVDAAVTSVAKANIGWGEQCQSYTMFMRASHVSGSKPELKAVFHWDKIPEQMELYGKRYIPGMAFLWGFNQEEKRNARQEVSASVIAASADSIDVKIKFPEVRQMSLLLLVQLTLTINSFPQA